MRPTREELENIVDRVAEEARRYLGEIDELPVIPPGAADAVATFDRPFPEEGDGAAVALDEFLEHGIKGAATSSSPRCFHFVMGGVTPAAFGADLLTAVLDNPPFTWVTSPIGVALEKLSINWLKDLFNLPSEFSGAMTTGATMANFVGLAAARQWWAKAEGVDVSEDGLTGLPRPPVFSSGYVHASSRKCLSMLGMGRSACTTFQRDDIGRLDAPAMEQALMRLEGRPAIIVANAGEVNAGDFDPIETMADLAEKYNAWLHVDGAFGLFARVSPRTEHLARGAERADSITVDGHKWLNVPYDCGFALVRDSDLVTRAFAYNAAYLPDPDAPRPTISTVPESSRRARSFAVWATLRAYGRSGYRELVEGHLDLAQHLAKCVDETPEFERLAEVPLNIVCFRYNPGGLAEEQLNELNLRLGEAIHDDGRVLAGSTQYGSKTALRPALVNWRTRTEDVDDFIAVVRELAASL